MPPTLNLCPPIFFVSCRWGQKEQVTRWNNCRELLGVVSSPVTGNRLIEDEIDSILTAGGAGTRNETIMVEEVRGARLPILGYGISHHGGMSWER